MIEQLTGLERQPSVPKPSVIERELHIAQTAVENLRRVLRLSETIHGAQNARSVLGKQEQKGNEQL
jgi:hypothetical protein